jgi:hypothetical protein
LTASADSAYDGPGFPQRGAHAPFHTAVAFPIRHPGIFKDFLVPAFRQDAIVKAGVSETRIELQAINSKGDTVYERILMAQAAIQKIVPLSLITLRLFMTGGFAVRFIQRLSLLLPGAASFRSPSSKEPDCPSPWNSRLPLLVYRSGD